MFEGFEQDLGSVVKVILIRTYGMETFQLGLDYDFECMLRMKTGFM